MFKRHPQPILLILMSATVLFLAPTCGMLAMVIASLRSEIVQLKHDRQILYFLVSIATDENNAKRAETQKRMEAYKKQHGLN